MELANITNREAQDFVESVVSRCPQVELPLQHIFTPNLYTRVIQMPAGTIVCSRVHKHDSPFFIMEGRCSLVDHEGNREELVAPHIGVTKAGTRRTILVHENTVWAGCFVTQETDPDAICDIFTDAADEGLLPEGFQQACYEKPRLTGSRKEELPCAS
jgi:hypothetical protein